MNEFNVWGYGSFQNSNGKLSVKSWQLNSLTSCIQEKGIYYKSLRDSMK